VTDDPCGVYVIEYPVPHYIVIDTAMYLLTWAQKAWGTQVTWAKLAMVFIYTIQCPPERYYIHSLWVICNSKPYPTGM